MDSYKSGNSYNHPSVKLKLQRNYIMNAIITQEEFEKYVNKFVEKLCCNDDTIDMWEYIKDHYYPETDIDDFYAIMTFSISKHEEILPITKTIPMSLIMIVILIWNTNIPADNSYISYLKAKKMILFMIAHTEAIREVFGLDSGIKSISGDFTYSYGILFNPQKEVLEGDLEHNDKLEFKPSYLESALKWLSQKQNHGLKMN